MALSNSERQARFRDRLKAAGEAVPYELDVLYQQTAAIEQALNEVRVSAGLPAIQLPGSANRAGNT